MTFKEELEILRGKSIPVFTGDPMDIPCIETSDTEKLCKHPVVSVHMITYNHEPYIRQAIEGVMMQETNFEYELVIGEDASTDKTREICFEYQKRYPDKIRVLWWHENLYRNPHLAGENGARSFAHCRGEFIALCEGDDYWIDPLKLQKQVDIMRKHPSVGLCFCGAKIYSQILDKWALFNEDHAFHEGMISGDEFYLLQAFGKDPLARSKSCGFIMTASTMIRHDVFRKRFCDFSPLRWKLAMGDTQLWLSMTFENDAYFLPDIVSVYRQLRTGACHQTVTQSITVDSTIVQLYALVKKFRLHAADFTNRFWDNFLVYQISFNAHCPNRGRRLQVEYAHRVFKLRNYKPMIRHVSALPMVVCLGLGLCNAFTEKWIRRYFRRVPRFSVPEKIHSLYSSINPEHGGEG